MSALSDLPELVYLPELVSDDLVFSHDARSSTTTVQGTVGANVARILEQAGFTRDFGTYGFVKRNDKLDSQSFAATETAACCLLRNPQIHILHSSQPLQSLQAESKQQQQQHTGKRDSKSASGHVQQKNTFSPLPQLAKNEFSVLPQLPERKPNAPWRDSGITDYLCPSCKRHVQTPHNRKFPQPLCCFSLAPCFILMHAAEAGECKLNDAHPGMGCIHCVFLQHRKWRCVFCCNARHKHHQDLVRARRQAIRDRTAVAAPQAPHRHA